MKRPVSKANIFLSANAYVKMCADEVHAPVYVPMDWKYGAVWSPLTVPEIDMCRDHRDDKTI